MGMQSEPGKAAAQGKIDYSQATIGSVHCGYDVKIGGHTAQGLIADRNLDTLIAVSSLILEQIENGTQHIGKIGTVYLINDEQHTLA